MSTDQRPPSPNEAIKANSRFLRGTIADELDLPLNLKGNKRNQFHPVLTAARARSVAQARSLPIVLKPA